MKKIIPFNYYDFSIRVISIDDEPWFLGKDIAELLKYERPSDAISQHCKKVLTQKEFKKLHGEIPYSLDSRLKLIPESDVWRLIIKSRLPEAEKIEEWIMEEVLPQIRKTGSYSIEKTDEPDLEKIKKRAELIHVASNLVIDYKKSYFEIGITRPEELGITVNKSVAKDTTVDFLEISEKKGLSTTEKYYTVTELCQIVMNGDFSEEAKKLVSTKKGDKPRPQNLNKLLEKLGFQEKDEDIWKATEKGKQFADFVQNKSKYSEKTVFHTVWKKEILNQLF
ncbi:prophage antirepressor [Thiovulum sp. ES]|nr:prophage antirepressor [Thiovulum sp. ES]